jgi:tripartite-type tricarboxylate transporter receptor subunit TctC
MLRWFFVLVGIVVCIGNAGAQNTGAQTYPNKPVRLIVTYPPGGSSDLMARVFGAKLAELWGYQVIVESKPGAAGAVGMDYAAKQPADGYTFVIGNSGPVAINPLLSNVPYNIEKDFIPVSLISNGPNVLVVQTESQFKSLAEIISFAKANPGKLNYGTSGPGSISHMSAEMLKNITAVQAIDVPYKGGVLGVQDLLGGQINFIFSDSLPAMAHIRSGKLRALCVTGAAKYALLPELPTCAANGSVPGLIAVNWWGVLFPAGTPPALVARLNADTARALADPDVKKRFADLGVEPVSSTPAEFVDFIRAEMQKYSKLIKEANIKVNL